MIAETERDPWYASWFGEEYLALYPDRDDQEAERQADFALRVLAPYAARGRGGILDLACGTGRHAVALRRGEAPVTGLDLSAPLLRRARARRAAPAPSLVRADMRRLPFARASFGAVVNFFTGNAAGGITANAAGGMRLHADGGVRLHAILPPLASDGTCISLRMLRRGSLRLADLEEVGMCTPAQTEQLRALIEQKAAFVVTGGTGAGKTTLLAAMLAEVDPSERILVVEDVLEIPLEHTHAVRLQARPANVEGHGLVTLVDLVRQALRMRPDRVVVGEVRGAEVRELLLALYTGHEGGCCTLHANSPADVPARIEALGALAGMSRDAVRAQMATALHAVVHIVRRRTGRVVASIEPLRL